MDVRSFANIQPNIADTCYIDLKATVIGDVHIDEQSSLWPNVILRGDVNKIRVGSKTNIQDNTVCHVTHAGPYTGDGQPLIIGNNVTVGHACILHACTIEDLCLIGMGSIIMDRAIIKSGSILAAGSLVPGGKILEGGYLYLGNPVKQIRPLTEEENTRLDYSAEHYVRLAKTYKNL